jgi:hypothetical protein
MRNTSSILYRIAVLVGFLVIDVTFAMPPRKPSASQFGILVSRSPFTIRATSDGSQVLSPLEKEWMLGSIRPNADGKGWSVTLINKKDRKQRVRFLPGFSADGFQLLEVSQDTSNPEASKVQVRQGTQTAWISYDEDLIKVRSKTAQRPTTGRIAKPLSETKGVVRPAPVQRTVTPAATSKGGVVRPVRTRYTPQAPQR